MPLSVTTVVSGTKSDFYLTPFMQGTKRQLDCAAMGDSPYWTFFHVLHEFQLDQTAMSDDLI